MSFLDDLDSVGHAVGGWAENLASDTAHAAVAPVMMGVDLATNVWNSGASAGGNPIDFLRDLAGGEGASLVNRVGDAGAPLSDLTGGASGTVGHSALNAIAAGSNYTHKALVQQALMIGRNPFSYQDNKDVKDLANTLTQNMSQADQQTLYNQKVATGMTPAQASAYVKSASGGLSFGQALTYQLDTNSITRNLASYVPILGSYASALDGGLSKRLNSPSFDIANPEDRQAAFATGFGKYVSGSVDFFNEAFLDPTIVAGKGIAALREAAILKPIVEYDKYAAPATTFGRNTAPLVSVVDKDAAPVVKSVRDLDTAVQTGRVTAMTDQLAALSPNKRAWQLSQMGAFKGNAPVQDLLTQANTPDAMRMVLRNAANPDALNKTQLMDHAATLQDQVTDIRDVRLPALERALATVQGKGPTAMAIPAQDIMDKITDMNRQLNNANDAAAQARAQAAAAGTLKFVPRETLADKLSSAQNWNNWQPSRYLPATRILKSAGVRRYSTVDLNRPGEATTAVTNMLNRVGHAWGVSAEAGMSAGKKGLLINAVAHAESQGTEATRSAMADAEHAAFHWYAMQVPGLDEDTIKSLVQSGKIRQDALRGQIFSSDTGRFSGVKGANGEFIDRWNDPTAQAGAGTSTTAALNSSQFADSVPMLDIDAMSRAVRLFRDASGDDWKAVAAKLRGDPGTQSLPLSGMATEAFEKFNRIWKPTQLLRLGWPVRVVTDEALRSLATFGAMGHFQTVVASIKHSAVHNRVSENLRDTFNAGHLLDKRAELEAATASRDTGMAHNDIVDHISTLDHSIGVLDPAIQDAGDALQALSVQRAGQGLVYRAASPGSKHIATGSGVDWTADQNRVAPKPGEVLHTKIIGAAPAEVFDPSLHATSPMLRAEAAGIYDPGVAALRATSRDAEFDSIRAMPNKDLAALVEREGGFSAKGLKSKAQLMSALGKIRVRRLGYKAIDHTDATGAHAYTALSEDAVKPDTYAKDYADGADHLQLLQDTRDDLAHRKGTLTNSLAGTSPWLQSEEDNWAQLKADALSSRDIAKAGGRPLKFAGTNVARVGSGAIVHFPDVHNGDFGRITADLTSAGKQMSTLTRGQDRYVNGYRVKMGSPTSLPYEPRESATPLERRLHALSYKAAYERDVNAQISNNPLTRQILAGKTDDEVVNWMRNDPAGKEERRKMGVFGHDPQELVIRNRQHVMSYLPSPELRAMALDPERQVTLDDLKQTIGATKGAKDLAGSRWNVHDPAQMPVIHGESLNIDTGGSSYVRLVNQAVDHAMKTLGTLPTDTLSRHPFSRQVYQESMKKQFALYDHLHPGEDLEPGVLDNFQKAAHEEALGKTREVLYDLSNESHFGHAMRFMAPFYNAWEEALKVWGNLVLNDPSLIARGIDAQNAPSKAGITYTDANGNTNMVVPLPQWGKDLMGGHNLAVPVTAVRDLVISGKYWYNPGLGAPVTVPLAAAVRAKPDLAETLAPLLPYGAGKNALDQLLPAGYRKLITANRQDDDQAYASSMVSIVHDLETDRALGKINMTDAQMAAEASRRAKSLSLVNLMGAFSLPFTAAYASPYEFYIDQAKSLAATYQKFNGGKDANGNTWQDAFLQKYGEAYFAFTQPSSKSNVGGISPTDKGFEAQQKYKDLIAANPQWGGLIAGDTTGQYNAAAQQYQLDNPIGDGNTRHMREQLDPVTAIRDQQTQQGWDMFRQVSTAVTEALKQAGLTSINQKAAGGLAAWKSQAVDAIKAKYPAWGDSTNPNSYETFTKGTSDAVVAFLGQHINDKGFADRPGYATLAQYLSARQGLEAQLASQKAAGGSDNLQDKANAPLKNWWDTVVGTLNQRDTYFADIYTRWLSNDKLENAS